MRGTVTCLDILDGVVMLLLGMYLHTYQCLRLRGDGSCFPVYHTRGEVKKDFGVSAVINCLLGRARLFSHGK